MLIFVVSSSSEGRLFKTYTPSEGLAGAIAVTCEHTRVHCALFRQWPPRSQEKWFGSLEWLRGLYAADRNGPTAWNGLTACGLTA